MDNKLIIESHDNAARKAMEKLAEKQGAIACEVMSDIGATAGDAGVTVRGAFLCTMRTRFEKDDEKGATSTVVATDDPTGATALLAGIELFGKFMQSVVKDHDIDSGPQEMVTVIRGVMEYGGLSGNEVQHLVEMLEHTAGALRNAYDFVELMAMVDSDNEPKTKH